MPNCSKHGVYYPDYPGCPDCVADEGLRLEQQAAELQARADRYEAALREAYSFLTDSGTAYRSNCIKAEIVIRKALDGGDQ